MDTRRILGIINLLADETSGHAGEIAALYKRALDENDDVRRLKTLLDDHEFYGPIGGGLADDARQHLARIYANPRNALDVLKQISLVSESIERETRNSDDLVRSPRPSLRTLTVIRKKDVEPYREALTRIAATCVHLMLVYGGTDSLKNLTWIDGVGILETMYAVNTRFIPALEKINRPSQGWTIRRVPMGGRALLDADCFLLTYEDTVVQNRYRRSWRTEPVGTHAWLNIEAYRGGKRDVPLCWGVGNLVSTTPRTALAVLGRDIVTRLRSPRTDELAMGMLAPLQCATRLADGKAFCITPGELLRAMNQWQTGHDIAEHRAQYACLFCGRAVGPYSLVCQSHFPRAY